MDGVRMTAQNTPTGVAGGDSGSEGQTSEVSEAEKVAFTSLYTTLVPPIRAYLARRVDYDFVDDLTADVFAVAWRKRKSVTAGEELPWLYTIASYVVSNHRRKLQRSKDLLAFFRVPDTAPAADTLVAHDPELASAWAGLKPAWREALALVVIDDMSVADAAKALGVSPNSLSIRLHRAKKALATALQASTGDPTPKRGKKTVTDDIEQA